MKKYFILALFVLGLMFGFSRHTFSGTWLQWQKGSHGISESNVRVLAVDPNNSSIVYAGTEKALYRSVDKAKNFKRIFTMPSAPNALNDIHIFSQNSNEIYLASLKGAYYSNDVGYRWQRIYSLQNSESRGEPISILRFNDRVYLGKVDGLIRQDVSRISWESGYNPQLVHQTQRDIQQAGPFLFFMTKNKIIRVGLEKGESWEVFDMGPRFRLMRSEEAAASFEEGESSLKSFFILPDDQKYIFASAKQGVFVSDDYGDKWEEINSYSLPLNDVTGLAAINLKPTSQCNNFAVDCFILIAATKQGAFIYQNNRWSLISTGLETNMINAIALDGKEGIYAATDRGVFYLKLKDLVNTETQSKEQVLNQATLEQTLVSFEDLDKKFSNEPTINEVHQFTIDYAEVHNQKIQSWRKLAQKRALMPNLSVGLDSGWDRTISDSIYGSSSSGGTHYIGPNDKSFSDDFGWDISLSWDLGDFIWSSEQTSIDSRAKLMVELREDLLDQVTRLYFERRRLQMEMLLYEALAPEEQIDRRLRLAELTALIDGFTGGKFTKTINHQKLARQ